ncbi:hypothetical protein [Microvirga tunisiensis]|nr:hypothetical protein [Microvirga tunisiensis]MPR12944.1 hypothetical protein [Microvirga tunisiensis]
MLAEVAKHLPTASPVETAKNLTNFKLMSHSARQAVADDPALTTFSTQLDRLGAAARALHSLDLPKASLEDRVWATAPTLKFRTGAEQSAIVKRLLSASPALKRAHAIKGMADHLGDLDDRNRTRLLERLIKQFERYKPGQETVLWPVACALAHTHNYLNDSQGARLHDAINKRPELGRLYANARDRLYNPLSPPEPAVVTQSSNLNNSITEIEASADELVRVHSRRGSSNNIHGIRAVAVSINGAYHRARAELTVLMHGKVDEGWRV